MAKLIFWYEFASTYSYLSAMRIERLAAEAGVDVEWRPFLLGPIFKAQGWNTSPFNVYPAKGLYMIRDMERITAARRLSFRMPEQFPAASLKAARMAVSGEGRAWLPAFSKAIYEAGFGRGNDISEDGVLAAIATNLGLDFAELSASSQRPDVKDKLRSRTAEAMQLGIFGAPTFQTADREIFWGDDRLQQAFSHSSGL